MKTLSQGCDDADFVWEESEPKRKIFYYSERVRALVALSRGCGRPCGMGLAERDVRSVVGRSLEDSVLKVYFPPELWVFAYICYFNVCLYLLF